MDIKKISTLYDWAVSRSYEWAVFSLHIGGRDPLRQQGAELQTGSFMGKVSSSLPALGVWGQVKDKGEWRKENRRVCPGSALFSDSTSRHPATIFPKGQPWF